METINEEILLQYIDGMLTANEVAAVEEWLSASPENEKLLEQLYFTREVVRRVRVIAVGSTLNNRTPFQNTGT